MEPIKDTHIAILMATYNGEKYLSEQIESILSQTYDMWHLYIHDDGSSDNTIEILHGYAGSHPEKITVLDYPPQGGALNNFMSLLERVDAEYYMFSDQDDVWFKDKIKKEKERMDAEEQKHGKNPIIVFSDLTVTDCILNKTADSFCVFSGIYPEYLTTFNELGASNLTTGCTMLFNETAKSVIQFPYTSATMHDSWITLCTTRANGILSYIAEPLIYYRQHEHNTLGAVNIKELTLGYRIQHLIHVLTLNKNTYRMLKALGYGSLMKYIFYKARYKYRIYKRQNKS